MKEMASENEELKIQVQNLQQQIEQQKQQLIDQANNVGNNNDKQRRDRRRIVETTLTSVDVFASELPPIACEDISGGDASVEIPAILIGLAFVVQILRKRLVN